MRIRRLGYVKGPNVQCQQALVMRLLQIDRWHITTRNENNVVDTVKQKCFEAAFEHFG